MQAHFFHTVVLLMPSGPIRFLPMLMLQNCCAVMAVMRELQVRSLHVIVRDLSP
jgi:hypothetical protein